MAISVDDTIPISFEEVKNRAIGRKVDCYRFLRFKRYDLHRLIGEVHNGHGVLLCRIIKPTRPRIA